MRIHDKLEEILTRFDRQERIAAAAINDDIGGIRAVLSESLDPAVMRSGLVAAATFRRPLIVQYLLDHGASAKFRDCMRSTNPHWDKIGSWRYRIAWDAECYGMIQARGMIPDKGMYCGEGILLADFIPMIVNERPSHSIDRVGQVRLSRGTQDTSSVSEEGDTPTAGSLPNPSAGG